MKLVYVGCERVTLYNVTDLSDALRIPAPTAWARVYRYKTLPEPTVLQGKRWYYSESEFNKICDDAKV